MISSKLFCGRYPDNDLINKDIFKTCNDHQQNLSKTSTETHQLKEFSRRRSKHRIRYSSSQRLRGGGIVSNSVLLPSPHGQLIHNTPVDYQVNKPISCVPGILANHQHCLNNLAHTCRPVLVYVPQSEPSNTCGNVPSIIQQSLNNSAHTCRPVLVYVPQCADLSTCAFNTLPQNADCWNKPAKILPSFPRTDVQAAQVVPAQPCSTQQVSVQQQAPEQVPFVNPYPSFDIGAPRGASTPLKITPSNNGAQAAQNVPTPSCPVRQVSAQHDSLPQDASVRFVDPCPSFDFGEPKIASTPLKISQPNGDFKDAVRGFGANSVYGDSPCKSFDIRPHTGVTTPIRNSYVDVTVPGPNSKHAEKSAQLSKPYQGFRENLHSLNENQNFQSQLHNILEAQHREESQRLSCLVQTIQKNRRDMIKSMFNKI